MIRRTSIKIAAGAAGLLLAGGAAAAAVDTPEEAAEGLSTAEEHSGVDVPVGAGGDHPTGEDRAPEPELETSNAPAGTHGAEVSAVATSDATEGREHGEAVSEVARDGHGADASELGAAHRADQAELGAGNAGEHGRP